MALVFWVALSLGCGSVERGQPCARHADCAEWDATCEAWTTADGGGRRTCEIVCKRHSDCPDREWCDRSPRGLVCTDDID